MKEVWILSRVEDWTGVRDIVDVYASEIAAQKYKDELPEPMGASYEIECWEVNDD